MVTNVLTHIEATTQTATRFLLSEYLTDVAHIHHEPVRIDKTLYAEAVDEVYRLGIVSVDFLRRQLKLAYPQAIQIVQQMEDDGLIRRTDHRSCDQRQGWRYEVL